VPGGPEGSYTAAFDPTLSSRKLAAAAFNTSLLPSCSSKKCCDDKNADGARQRKLK